MENRSSSLYVHPILNAIMNGGLTDTLNQESLKQQIDNNFFSGLRFMGANSTEFSIEQSLNMPVFSRGDLSLGFKYLIGNGNALQEFQRRIVNFDRDEVVNLDPAFENQAIDEYSFFLQLFQPLGRQFNLLLGGQYLNRNNGDFAAHVDVFNPRLALLYKASSKLQFRASYSTAIRAPSPFFSATTYTFDQSNLNVVITGAGQLEAEETRSYELGVRWSNYENINLDISTSYTRTNQFINYNVAFEGGGFNQRPTGFYTWLL